jgi:hypothetical protein
LEEADKVVLASSSAVWKAPIGSRIIFSGQRRGDGLNLNAALSVRDDQRRSTCPIEQDRRLNNVDVSLESVRRHFDWQAPITLVQSSRHWRIKPGRLPDN